MKAEQVFNDSKLYKNDHKIRDRFIGINFIDEQKRKFYKIYLINTYNELIKTIPEKISNHRINYPYKKWIPIAVLHPRNAITKDIMKLLKNDGFIPRIIHSYFTFYIEIKDPEYHSNCVIL